MAASRGRAATPWTAWPSATPRSAQLTSASLTSGHSFTAADSDSYVAIVDSGYATSHSLKVGSAISTDNARYTVIGIVSQPAASSPPDVYVPLARAQAMPLTGPA